MSHESLLIDCVYFLLAVVTFVPLFRAIGLGSTLGYLAAGVVLGPDFIGVIDNDNFIFKLGDFGLIFLLFVIGLELSPRRLSQLRKRIFIDGIVQFTATSMIMTFVLLQLGYHFTQAYIMASAFSLSSTAFVLHYLKESKQLTLSYGKSSFGILLFQDLAIIPILTLIPFLSTGAEQTTQINLGQVTLAIIGLSSIVAFGHYALKPLITFVHQKASHEIFVATSLLTVLGISFLITKLGLSEALGAFMAGIFLSDFEFKKEVENVIIPFKGMLLGTFFMSFGLQFQVSFVRDNINHILALTSSLLIVKASILLFIGHTKLKSYRKGIKLSLLMSQGGEFGFILLATAFQHKIMPESTTKMATASVLITLFLAPIMAKLSEFIGNNEKVQTPIAKIDDEQITEENSESIQESTDNIISFPEAA